MLLALAFVPEAEVTTVWEEFLTMPNRLLPADHPFIEYFLNTFIGKLNRNKTRKRPLFPVTICRDRLLNGDPRTTNSVEGWHRAFNQTVAEYHPRVYKLFDKLRDEQHHHELVVQQLAVGNPAP